MLWSTTADEYENALDIIKALHDAPAFLPWEHIRDKVLWGISLTAAILTITYSLVYLLLQKLIKNPPKDLLKTGSYQATNLTMNFALGFIGLVYTIWHIPAKESSTIEERIVGYESLHVLASMILGYQVWSVPMGIFVTNESSLMLIHHFSTCIVGGLSAFMMNGFRYHNPFFFGVAELSSVPLSVMNFFKTHKEVRQSNPVTYNVVRVGFMLAFLYIRVYLWLPRMYDYIKLAYILGTTSSSTPISMLLYGSLGSGAFLTVLQLFWAYKIVHGFIIVFFGKKKRKSKQT